MEIIFPGHDLTSWRRGDQRSAAKQISVDKYVSHDLQHLAPRVVQLIENFLMDVSMVNSMLEDQLNTQEAYTSVACRWLQSNTQTWQAWLPKASECLPRFGVYDPQSGFLSDPAGDSGTNDLECRACETGSYSVRSRDKNGSTFICETCPPGTAQELPGALSCDLCPKGNFQDLHGSTSCKRCSIGSYQDAKGQSACKDCPDGTTSIGLASQSISECGCNEGTINVGQLGRQPPLLKDDIRCVRCIEGIRCPFASSIGALQSGTSPLGDRFLPTIQRGYYSTVDQPLIIFKCRKAWHCPGRVPGQCARGRTEIACAQCRAGQTWMGNRCADCNLWVTGAWVVGIIVFLIMIACSYYLVSNHISARASLSESVGMISLVVLNAAQCLAIIGLVDLQWPSEVEATAQCAARNGFSGSAHLTLLLSAPNAYRLDEEMFIPHKVPGHLWDQLGISLGYFLWNPTGFTLLDVLYSGWPIFGLLRQLRGQLSRLETGEVGDLHYLHRARRIAAEGRPAGGDTMARIACVFRPNRPEVEGDSCAVLEAEKILQRAEEMLMKEKDAIWQSRQKHLAFEELMATADQQLRRLVDWFQAPGEGFRAPGARLAAGVLISADAVLPRLERLQRHLRRWTSQESKEGLCGSPLSLPQQGALVAEASYVQRLFTQLERPPVIRQWPAQPDTTEAWVTFLWGGRGKAEDGAWIYGEAIRTLAHSVRRVENPPICLALSGP
eukprot:s1416_g4.t1